MLIGVSFAVVVEGQIPEDSSDTAVTLWTASVGLSFFFLLGSMLLLVQLQRLMGSWMRTKLRSHLNILRKVMREGVRLDSFLLHECGVPRPGSAALSPELQALWADIDSAADDRPTPGTEAELERELAEHLVLLRWVLVEVHEPEQDFREYQKRQLKWARTASRGGLQLGTLMLLVNSAVQIQTLTELFFDYEEAGWVFVALVVLTAVVGYVLPRTMNYFLPPVQTARAPPIGRASGSAASIAARAGDSGRERHSAAASKQAQPGQYATTEESQPGLLASAWAWLTGGGSAVEGGPVSERGLPGSLHGDPHGTPAVRFIRNEEHAAARSRPSLSRRPSVWAGPEDGVAKQPLPAAVDSPARPADTPVAHTGFINDPSKYSSGAWAQQVGPHPATPMRYGAFAHGGGAGDAKGGPSRQASATTHSEDPVPQLAQAIRRTLMAEYGGEGVPPPPPGGRENSPDVPLDSASTGSAGSRARVAGHLEQSLRAHLAAGRGRPPADPHRTLRIPLPADPSSRSLVEGQSGGSSAQAHQPWRVPGQTPFGISPAYASSDM